jgi:hypothetical protein
MTGGNRADRLIARTVEVGTMITTNGPIVVTRSKAVAPCAIDIVAVSSTIRRDGATAPDKTTTGSDRQ